MRTGRKYINRNKNPHIKRVYKVEINAMSNFKEYIINEKLMKYLSINGSAIAS